MTSERNKGVGRFDLTGRVVLVTGASRGIGAALATALAESGASLVVGARKVENLQTTAEAVSQAGSPVLAVPLDVTDVASIEAAVDAATQRFGRLDGLVNNAGVEDVRPSFDVDETLWDRILDTNLKGAFFAAQAAGRAMRMNGSGSIVNIASLTSMVGVPTAVPYGSSKSGLLGMTRALAAEWAPVGIRVNAIAPGYFRTAMTDVFYENEDWRERMLGRIPMNRFGDLDDLAGAALFLASDASRYMTGQCIAIDGGFLASI
ncbi:SDR family NAD(P)-dependent oxidoreductase [Aureimonas phyllosphaerae]|uniref:NAD(P)-dependent dehydrogenase (Short-subunit alcohol dehydrogenase family) n=1 Tax=Aureimonas phyllosphaerae TaxID=1166078 RepID=A0A7W6BV18_9HYPH|nr:glucose 1-dehydrogenase [Aureimonas phyllosphaerae]MBB3934256.1 NAD(P)-dependent dehydrogenase (short-subunit alcohol dehydrogenase family) [Aureimonas phyllosphaerae]MBB3958528.1 NAD(P)-dependent dehydrogenase (short-subunit alcohol dehydrogenase family) [Aureimonas phyllosphaerae]SFE98389.1 NAD(P)-dependent dehydrogenase, short-chain alcohol dehydrogenase family [Aureimonas phyllosphaerae]